VKWTEETGRRALHGRVGDARLCEIHGLHRGAEASHRRDLSKRPVDPWSPVNLVWSCSTAHRWLHQESTLADLGGWRIVRDDIPPELRPVWLATPWPGWWRLFLAADGEGLRRHLIEPVDPTVWGLPVRPAVLPPMEVAA
jgi:hypothetical protein